MPAIHQLVAGFQRNDAISNTAVLLRRFLRQWGWASDIYCQRSSTAPDMRGEAKDLESLVRECRSEDTVILHLSIGCRANDLFPGLPCRKVILYHNVTPAEYFARINPSIAGDLAEGRRQCAALAGVADVTLADSEFNARELRDLGYRSVGVLPLMVDLSAAHREVSSAYMERFGDGLVNILFVGRVVPNKRHDELLRVFHDFQHTVEPRSRLVIVGSTRGCEVYQTLLLGMVYTLELQRVVFTGAVSQAELNACYRTASAFLCMSEHEGFCAPLLEAMHHDLPVVAAASAAVPETMAEAGLLFPERDHALIAESLGRVVADAPFRAAVLARQRQRLARYLGRDLEQELRTALAPVLH